MLLRRGGADLRVSRSAPAVRLKLFETDNNFHGLGVAQPIAVDALLAQHTYLAV
jgi:hypothetical protein